jgi:hypothetical protein
MAVKQPIVVYAADRLFRAGVGMAETQNSTAVCEKSAGEKISFVA